MSAEVLLAAECIQSEITVCECSVLTITPQTML